MIFKIEDLNAESRRRRPDGWTRGGHARKHVAIGHAIWPRFRGSLDEICYVISWESCTRTLLPISPINTPAEQQRGGSQRLKLGFFFRFFSLPKFLVFSFLLFKEEYFDEGEERCIWKVTSNKRLLFLLYYLILFFCLDRLFFFFSLSCNFSY